MVVVQPMPAADNARLLRRKLLPPHALFHDFGLLPLIHSTSPAKSTSKPKVLETTGCGTSRDPQDVAPPKRPCWTPTPLKRHILLGFITVFASLLVALAILFGYSRNHHGLSTADQRLYYVWTYGPTAGKESRDLKIYINSCVVLSMVAVSWAQVVYRTKQLMPWKTMTAAPQTASKSVLLDYASPSALVALLRALSSSHHTVSAIIISSFILIGLTISSTALFTPQCVDVVGQNVPVLTTDRFDFAGFDWASTDARPAENVYATSILGLRYLAGTTAQYAVQGLSGISSEYRVCSTTSKLCTYDRFRFKQDNCGYR